MKFKLATAILSFAFLLLIPVPEARADVGDWQKGLTLRLIDESEAEITASLEQAKATGANYIAITPGWLTDTKTSSNVVRKDRTPSDALLIFTINKAHELGMDVMLKPHLDVKAGGWRAFINPNNKGLFFQNYSNMMLHYAAIAEQTEVELFSVGAELYTLSTNPSNEQYWRNMITEIRNVYSGDLTYSANADGFFDEAPLPFWDMLDYWGVSMYVEVADNKTPTKQSILQKWQEFEEGYVLPALTEIDLPMIAAEIGYRSVDGAGISPENFSSTPAIDLEEQALLYESFFEFWKTREYFKGVHFWDWKPSANAGGPGDNDYTPQNKPAQQVITSYFTSVPDDIDTEEPDNTPNNLIANVNPTSYSSFNISVGSKFYSDRDYSITSLPNLIEGGEYIKTKNSDKLVTSADFLSFTLSEEAVVYIAYDSRATRLPSWLSNWQKTSDSILTNDVSFNLYKKSFAPGKVTLGGNLASPSAGVGSNYFVIAKSGQDSSLSEEPEESEEPSVENPPAEEPKTPVTNPSEVSAETKSIVVEEPTEDKTVSGEKKLKAYVKGLGLNQYDLYYDVESKGEVKMDNTGFGFKQAKIEFDEWNWHGEGAYSVVLTAYNKSGLKIASKNIKINVRH